MKAYVALALERWADEYNEMWVKRNNWDEWLESHQDIPEVKALLARSEANDAKA
jgi:hypothetical protein